MNSRSVRSRPHRNVRLASLELLEDRRLLATLTVTSAADSGAGTLRQAIIDSNGQAGPNTIDFNIPGSGVQSITLTSDLPAISTPVTIDGYSQPGAQPNSGGPRQGDNAVLLIQINDGGRANTFPFSPLDFAFSITGGDTTIRGLAINNNFVDAIDLESDGNTLAGNFIGTNADGMSKALTALTDGVKLEGSHNDIGGTSPADRNVISGWLYGVKTPDKFSNPANASVTGNVIEDNLIGLDATGTKGLFNNNGIEIDAGSSDTIGGTAAGAGNVITGDNFGISINQLGLGNGGGLVIEGNLFGTDASGTATVQTPSSAASGGIGFSGDATAMYFADGTTPSGATAPNTVGGTGAGAGNVISGCILGIDQLSNMVPVVVEGNLIGVDISGSKSFNNIQGILADSPSNTIGGTLAGAGNTIAFNSDPTGAFPQDIPYGVSVGVSGNSILGNSIYGNASQGIADNFSGAPAPPVLTSVSGTTNGMTQIDGTLQETPSSSFRLEFFASTTADPSGFGQGQTYLGFTKVTTDPNGKATFSVPVTGLPAGESVVSATATDSMNTTSGFAKDFTPSASSEPTTTLLNVPGGPLTVGQTATLAAIVSAGTGGAPSGSVTFTIDGVAQSPVPLAVSNGQDQATLATSTLAVGTHVVSAAYSGDSAFQASASPQQSFQVVASSETPAPTTTQLVVPSAAVLVGHSATVEAIVSPLSSGVPSGSVVFTIDGVAQRPVQLTLAAGKEQATLAMSTLAVGTHVVSAAYSGDSAFQASASPQQSFQVVANPGTKPATDGPHIMSMERFGVHRMPTTIVLTFDRALNPATAQNAANYQIIGPGGQKVSLAWARYDASSRTISLRPSHTLNFHLNYRLTVRGAAPQALTDSTGNLLDGASTGQPGSNYQTTLTWRDLVLPAIYSQRMRSARDSDPPLRNVASR